LPDLGATSWMPCWKMDWGGPWSGPWTGWTRSWSAWVGWRINPTWEEPMDTTARIHLLMVMALALALTMLAVVIADKVPTVVAEASGVPTLDLSSLVRQQPRR